MHWRNGALWGGFLLALWCGCGGDEEPTPPAPAAPVVSSLASTLCDTAFRCCTRGEANYFMGPFVSQDNCAERLMMRAAQEPSSIVNFDPMFGLAVGLPNLGALEQANAEGRGTVDGAAVLACIDYLRALPCPSYKAVEKDDGKCKVPEPPAEATPCDAKKLFKGLVQEGGVCSSDGGGLECAQDLVCRTDPQLGVNGRCVRLGAVGDACTNDTHCREKLYCSLVDGTCQERRKQGEACAYSDRDDPTPDPSTLIVKCDSHLSCDPITEICVEHCQRGAACDQDSDCDQEQELYCVAERCDRRRAEGLPCQQDTDCQETLRCEQDLADITRKVCTPKLADGDPCGSSLDCTSGFCHPLEHTCAARKGANERCETGQDQQCAAGRCERESVTCQTDEQCPISGLCVLSQGMCSYYCVQTKDDGAKCTADTECRSEACIAGFCRTPPLETGQECSAHEHCDTGFCGLEKERICTELPLPLGARCATSSQCESLVCFDSAKNGQPTCTTGLSAGEACGDPDQQPCNRHKLFCDTVDQAKPVCMPLHETGDDCERDEQCRGTCVIKFARHMCSAQAAPKAAICNGAGAPQPDAGN
jgi:hypothetical protein